ncbi:helix-turn-helix domain-containing protein [Enterococcus hirae]|uniref:helix-turn-helix domain-containing protein n=1 Tax=Enterococcus hirae TaxID=1354 RepID=UPI0020740693|nr:helix-turn-helix domain-containing protein [Enterococcus hirae]
MFEKYMEKDLKRKINIINLLWENPQLTSLEIGDYLGVTAATIKSDIKFINFYYCLEEVPLIISSSNGYCILNKESRNKVDYLKKVYKDSLFIRACCFFLKNNFTGVNQFADEEFISKSKAYYLKEEVLTYLSEVEIINSLNEVDECRLRFLLTFFQMKLDEEFVKISKNNKIVFLSLFREFEKIEICLLSDYSKEYASILFQLHFNRRNKTCLNFDQIAVDLLKNTKVYERLSKPIILFLEKELHGQAKEEEIFFFVLIFNLMNANYFDETNRLTSYQSYVQLISNSPVLYYNELVCLFEREFNIELKKEKLFEATLISFLRKCIFNLQILIPEEHMELGNSAEVPEEIVSRIKSIFCQWNDITQIPLIYSDDHIKYFTSKLYFLLSKKARPQNLYLLTSFYTDYLLAKEILNRECGGLVKIHQFNPNKKMSEFAINDLVLYDTQYEILKYLPCVTLKISYIFDLVELQMIRKQLFGYDLKGITCNKYAY